MAVENQGIELITLSTQAFTYFQSKGGFAEGSPDDLPPAREKYGQGGHSWSAPAIAV
jgi:amino-acid N-acetyltransferase